MTQREFEVRLKGNPCRQFDWKLEFYNTILEPFKVNDTPKSPKHVSPMAQLLIKQKGQ